MRSLPAKGFELTFLGTCGEIEKRTRRHRRHSALLLRHGMARVMIDCGADWRMRVARLAPSAIVLTHGHPDHAFGLADGVSCPVYATAETWQLIDRYPIADRRVVSVDEPLSIEGVRFEAIAVEHSTRAPAVGYRITSGSASIFYVPDVVTIPQRRRALRGIDLYIGDGATITQSMVWRRNGRLIGHTTIRAQLGWCEAEGVGNAIFTHCGSAIVSADARRVGALVRRLARERHVAARIAHDGLRIVLTGATSRGRRRAQGQRSPQDPIDPGQRRHDRPVDQYLLPGPQPAFGHVGGNQGR